MRDVLDKRSAVNQSEAPPPTARRASRRASIVTRAREHLAAPLYRNGYFLTLGAGFTSLSGFVFWAIAARRYPPAVVGLNSAAIATMVLVSAIAQLGLNAVIVRYLPAAGRSTRKVLLTTYGATGAFSLVAAFAVAATTPQWAPRLGFLAHGLWLPSFVAATVFWSVFTLQDSALTGMRAAHWVPIENSAFSVAKILLLVVFVGSAPRSGVFFAWNVPVLLSLVPVNLLIFRRLIPKHMEQGSARVPDSRSIVRFAGANYAGSMFLLGSTTLLPILVAAWLGAKATAYFYMPWMIATGIQLIALSMTTSLMVELAFDESQIRDYARRVVVQTMRILVPIITVLAIGAHYVLQAFGAAYAAEGVSVMRLLAIAALPNVFVVLGLAIARIQHDGRTVLMIQAATCVGTLGLTALLLPRIGIDGVGWAWLATQTSVAAWLLAGKLRRVLFGRSEVAYAQHAPDARR